MRKLVTLGLLIAPALLAASAAQAAPLPAPQAMRSALEATVTVQTVACARYGWRGYGVYPGCYRRPVYAMAAPVYVPPPVYVVPPVYAPRRCWVAGAWRPC